ncbi:MAG: 30S ribosomal protein S18 [Candidatus Nealsonbacteria bacterium CG23_combo_of_CG06-09_8_20_14_all_39_17]|uniref:30S ribosomal protein S18 n=1 Tax=Candidatus Nealsonbacteria bacterium CG23_combo_of_CG06-09_8_20_14_all_39_17 TaxID=1974722 RepID=A0A2G9YU18_9BACT|nr:MAG: 30S ribosomal protein S18 [Candidatus Nealsonbacteria bacterium CG23_combo_of_CG06-09_8_20_14_all_39_17]
MDFKNTDALQKFISGMAKIKPGKKTGTCSSHQRKISEAIKRARYLGLFA